MISQPKKKKVSKKNKSAWRKHTDIEDVNEFLEEQRQSERIGDFSIKKDEELFTIDTKECPKLLLSAKERRKLNALKPAKNLIPLENTSAVQDPLVQRDKRKLRKNGRNLEEEILNPTKQKHVKANKDRQNYNLKLKKKLAKGKDKVFEKDIWEVDRDSDLKEFTKQPWVSKQLALHNLKNTGRILAKIPETFHKKTTKLKSIEKPDPGMSYNPSLKDHQRLVQKVIENEEEIIREEKHLTRVTTASYTKMTAEQRDEDNMKQILAVDPDDDENMEGIKTEGTDTISCSLNPPVIDKKKAKKARRHEKEQKDLQKKVSAKKIEKKKLADINNIKRINEEVLIELEKKNEQRKKKKKEMKQKRLYGTQRLGRNKFEEPEIDVNDASAIAGNLRNVQTESSLLMDRFKAFQKRNILPVTVDVGVRKRRKIKRFPRSSHKEKQQPIKVLSKIKNNKK